MIFHFFSFQDAKFFSNGLSGVPAVRLIASQNAFGVPLQSRVRIFFIILFFPPIIKLVSEVL